MKKYISGIIMTLLLVGCNQKEEADYLVKFYEGEFDEIGAPSGYLNKDGDTVVALGKYYAYSDTIRDFGMLLDYETGKILGINQFGKELFEVYNYDNGPDYPQSDLFRILKNGKLGYANLKGEIIIEPRFVCAYPFEGEFAKVADTCETIALDDHSAWESDNWYLISKEGIRVEE